MPELHPLVCFLATLYASVLAGTWLGLAVWRFTPSRGGLNTGPIWLPFLTPGAVSVLAAFHPPDLGLLQPGHQIWHAVEEAILTSPPAHALLHLANLLLVACFLVCLARAVYRGAQQVAFLRALTSSGIPDRLLGVPVVRLPAAVPACFTAGVLRPRVFVTESLLTRVSGRDLQVMLAHEQAHLRRVDRLSGFTLQLLFDLFPAPGAARFLREWRRRVERACDESAADRVGSRHEVAAALVRAAALLTSRQPFPGAAGFADDAAELEARVHALLAPTGPDRPSTGILAAGLCCGVLLLTGFWVRHLIDLFVHH